MIFQETETSLARLAFGWLQPINDWSSSGIVACCKESHGFSFSNHGVSHGRPKTFTIDEGTVKVHFSDLWSVKVDLRFIGGQFGLFEEFPRRHTWISLVAQAVIRCRTSLIQSLWDLLPDFAPLKQVKLATHVLLSGSTFALNFEGKLCFPGYYHRQYQWFWYFPNRNRGSSVLETDPMLQISSNTLWNASSYLVEFSGVGLGISSSLQRHPALDWCH